MSTEPKIALFSADTNSAGHAPSEVGRRASELEDYSRRGGFSGSRIREQLGYANCVTEQLNVSRNIVDYGDHQFDGVAIEQAGSVERLFDGAFERGEIPICLGGDHLVKTGGIHASLKRCSRLGVLYLDAHPDMRIDEALRYDTILHHAFAQGLDPINCALLGLRQTTVEEAIGVRHYNPHFVLGSTFSACSIRDISRQILSWLGKCDAVYVSIDPDGITPAEIAAVEQYYPGGPTTDQILQVLRKVLSEIPLIAGDISEHVPELDERRMTATCLAKLLLELSAIPQRELYL
jgi:arginase family enzyme